MSALTEQEKAEKARIERARHEHAEFFEMPVDGLTDAERRARGPYPDDTRE